eukprot:COSAG05_NODE_6208_length_1000_cov_0.815760_1_plen_304_part_01
MSEVALSLKKERGLLLLEVQYEFNSQSIQATPAMSSVINILKSHRSKFKRIAQLAVPDVADATGPKLCRGGWLVERDHAVKEILTPLELQGWKLLQPTKRLWDNCRNVIELTRGCDAKSSSIIREILDMVEEAFDLERYATAARVQDSKMSKMTIFDFAGQRMYYHMHHIFITPKLSIYLLAFNLDKDPGSCLLGADAECGLTQLDNLHFWLNSIHAQAPQAPIFVVATHRNQVADSLAKTRLEIVHQSFEGKPFYHQICNSKKVFCVDNRDDDDMRFDELKVLMLADFFKQKTAYEMESRDWS